MELQRFDLALERMDLRVVRVMVLDLKMKDLGLQ